MITFNNSQIHQDFRPRSNFNSAHYQHQPQFYYPKNPQTRPNQKAHFSERPISNAPAFQKQTQHSKLSISEAKLGISSMNQLSEDLNRLKQQLQKLALDGDSKENKLKREPAIFMTARDRTRSNLSAQPNIIARRQHSRQSSHPSHQAKVVQFRPQLSKNATLRSLKVVQGTNKGTQQANKVAVFINPNIRQQEKMNNQRNLMHNMKDGNVQIGWHIQINRLRQRIIFLQNQLEISKLQRQNLKIQLKSACQKVKQQQILLQSNKQMIKNEVKIQTNQIQEQRLQYNQIIQKLRDQLSRSNKEVTVSASSFDQALKNHIQNNEQLKMKVQEQSQLLLLIKEENAQHTKIIENLEEQLRFQQIKIGGELKTKTQRLQIDLVERNSELQSAKRALQTLDARYRATLKEVQSKDDFIMKYLIGRSSEGRQKQVIQLFNQFKAAFTTPPTLQQFLIQQKELQQLRNSFKRC